MKISPKMKSYTSNNGDSYLLGEKNHRCFFLHGNMENNGIILHLKLYIIDNLDGCSRYIKFPFDLHGDTPIDVIDNMQINIPKLKFSNEEFATITKMITIKIFKVLQYGDIEAYKFAQDNYLKKLQQDSHNVSPKEQIQHEKNSTKAKHVLINCGTSLISKHSHQRFLKKEHKEFMESIGAITNTKCDVDPFFSNSKVGENSTVTPNDLAILKYKQKEELKKMQQRHAEEYLHVISQLKTKKR